MKLYTRFFVRKQLAAGMFIAGTLFFSAVFAHEGQRSFATPADAVNALVAATQNGDKNALQEIFGSHCDEFLTGDDAQDTDNFKNFSNALNQKCVPVERTSEQVILEIGTERWPFPIPLAKENGRWFFNTEAGKEEILNRHIGCNELHAVSICRDYAKAQQQS